MKEFHAKKWLNEEFKKYDMCLQQQGGGTQEIVMTLFCNTDVSSMSLFDFVFDVEWTAIPQTHSFRFCYDQLRLICGAVDELNRQHDMEMNV